MRGQYGSAAVAAIENGRNNLRSTATSCMFGAVAKTVWPRKTAHELAFICKVSERTASYWLSGECDPSPDAFLAIFSEMRRR